MWRISVLICADDPDTICAAAMVWIKTKGKATSSVISAVLRFLVIVPNNVQGEGHANSYNAAVNLLSKVCELPSYAARLCAKNKCGVVFRKQYAPDRLEHPECPQCQYMNTVLT